MAQAGATRTRARDDRARQLAAQLVARHGASLIVEDCDLGGWARRWGPGMFAFTPGRLVGAVAAEAAAVAQLGADSGLLRAATGPTALSQHCLCGVRVAKSLADRIHDCPG